jgi:hypothetical protein
MGFDRRQFGPAVAHHEFASYVFAIGRSGNLSNDTGSLLFDSFVAP